MDTRVLVVGGAGYVGGAVTDQLQASGTPFTVYDNLTYEDHYLKPVDFIHGDIRDRDTLAKLLPNYSHVVWLAALVGDGACAIKPQLTWEVNTEPVQWLAHHFDGRIIFTSTCSVYGANQQAVSEESPTHPLSIYAQTKLAAEQSLAGRNALVLRLGTAFGIPDAYSRIRMDLAVNLMTMHALTQGKLTVYGGAQWRPFVHVKDIARIIVGNLAAPHAGIFNVATANCTIAELGEAIRRETGCTIEYTEQKFQDQRNYNADVGKARLAGILPEPTEFDITYGIRDIKGIAQSRRVKDFTHAHYSNHKHLERAIEQYEQGFQAYALHVAPVAPPPAPLVQPTTSVSEEPRVMDGGIAVDDRGAVAFANGFTFEGVKRFYMLENHRQGFIRAWHAHRHEGKYILVVQGAALIGAVRIEGDWEQPRKDASVFRRVLSANKPTIVYIPPGYANGAMSLTADAKVLYFSTRTLEESMEDDVRYDARYWDIWNVEER